MAPERILLSSSFKDFFELDSNMYMIEMLPKEEWIGKSLAELGLRKTHNLNVVAAKEEGTKWHFVDPKKRFGSESSLLVVMEKKDMENWK